MVAAAMMITACSQKTGQSNDGRAWLAGDHHVHSEWSVGWDNATNPPTPIKAGDAKYAISRNAEMAKKYGLEWMVSTDHGGPLHSKVNLEQAYPAVQEARKAVPDLVLFYGMEFDTPAADHTSLIIPKTDDEAQKLHGIESQFAKREPWPEDKSWNTEEKMINALKYIKDLNEPPVMFNNHPARSAKDKGVWGDDTPEEFRNWNDTAPNVAVGFEGAPGHQAGALDTTGALDPEGERGGYGNFPTMGGYDQMTAVVGGLWDSMLGEGRHWWTTSTSDQHVHYTDGGTDFYPGEYSKTYVKANKDHKDILEGLRHGRIFNVLGDLISELDVTVEEAAPAWKLWADNKSAAVGETLTLSQKGADVNVTIRLRDPNANNAHGDNPNVNRVDLIMGEVTGSVKDRSTATNPTSKVVQRFDQTHWKKDGEYITISYTLKDVEKNSYIRLRGTNTNEMEPAVDPKGEDPWKDLWFYSNPIFIKVE
ncbi:phosphoesterase [Paenibacillus xerothermodurans]|uniref:Phosphoesterase n=2 Tax=Paenibacillus xerothermodurans TaxID=1977292 RepID=A0A2W1N8G0_PAEXE|nr:phosphoesterase [Paenibacillus xerothermodurans]